MIIRKPYAFLIKNFRKVHVVLLLISFWIFRATLQTTTFMNEFVDLQSYNSVVEPISRYLGLITYLCVFIMIGVSFLLGYLLRQRGKPWKMYLVLVSIYSFLLLVFFSITMYFVGFSDASFKLQTAKLFQGLIFLSSAPQFVAFIILVIRILGIDLSKFDFANDQELLEIRESDKEEVEISFEFDKHIIYRLYQKLLRNFEYFYQEHKTIVNAILVVVVIVIVWNIYYFFGVTHKSYRQGKTLKIDGYEITVNNSYYTDKDYRGEKIEKGRAFVILDMTIKNRDKEEVMKMDNFHLMNWSNDYSYSTTYNTSFDDLGKVYNNDKWMPNKSYNFLLVFKVDEKNVFSNFVLYYQEYHNRMETYLRKMKLKVKDIRNIDKEIVSKNNKELTFEMPNEEKKSVIFRNSEFGDEFGYKIYRCTASGCRVEDDTIKAMGSNRILKITYDSADFDGKDFVDFSEKYGKIKYVDTKGKKNTIDVVDYIDREYQGRYLYLKVPKKLNPKKSLEITYVIRNKKYVYKIK